MLPAAQPCMKKKAKSSRNVMCMRIAVPAIEPMFIDHDMNAPPVAGGGMIADGGKMGLG
jgi:hypothetical protein